MKKIAILAVLVSMFSVNAYAAENKGGKSGKSCEQDCYDKRKDKIDKDGNSHKADKNYDKCKDQCDRKGDKKK